MASEENIQSLVIYSMPLGFAQIFTEIAVLSAEVDRKDWSWLLPRNALTEAEIYAHPSFEKIRIYCGQIDNLYHGWRKSGSISDEEFKDYHVNRMQVETDLSKLRIKIIERKPTILDKILKVIERMVTFIRSTMPYIEQVILDRLGFSINNTINSAQQNIMKRLRDL